MVQILAKHMDVLCREVQSLIYPVKVASCLYKTSGVEEATIIYPDYTFQCEKNCTTL